MMLELTRINFIYKARDGVWLLSKTPLNVIPAI